jgi:hypothetical protein
MDTARTVVDVIWAGITARHPDMNLVLAHAGGVLPVLAPRLLDLAPLDWVPDPAGGITYDQLREQLGRLYCDTAIAGTDSTMKPLLEMTDPSHIIFGTGYPAAAPSVIDANLAVLSRTRLLTDKELSAIATNATRIFPALRTGFRPAQRTDTANPACAKLAPDARRDFARMRHLVWAPPAMIHVPIKQQDHTPALVCAGALPAVPRRDASYPNAAMSGSWSEPGARPERRNSARTIPAAVRIATMMNSQSMAWAKACSWVCWWRA